MTTDEKLDRLTDRVDAVVQSVELLATLHRDLEAETAKVFAETAERFAETAERFAETAKGFAETAKGFEETAKGFAETRARFAETLGFINRLAHVAESYGQRLDDLEAK
jgi:methyl-accepting chemotaxis protein